MDYYSNTRPRLFSNELQNSINRMTAQKSSILIQDNVTVILSNVYYNIVKPNFIVIFLVGIIISALYYRYNEKQKKNKIIKNIEADMKVIGSLESDLEKLKRLDEEEKEMIKKEEEIKRQQLIQQQLMQQQLMQQQLENEIRRLQEEERNGEYYNEFTYPQNAKDTKLPIDISTINYDDIKENFDGDYGDGMNVLPPWGSDL